MIFREDTIDELTARIQELQNEVNCVNDLREFKDAESERSGPSHVSKSTGIISILSRSRMIAKPQQSAARYLEFAWNIGKRFCKSMSVFFVALTRRIQSLDC